MNTVIVRLVVSPPLAPHSLDEVMGALAPQGLIHVAVNDPDVNASVLSVSIPGEALAAVLESVAAHCGPNLSAGRAFRFDVMVDRPDQLADDDVRSLAVHLHGIFSAPVYVARREAPPAAWSYSRPMPWGRKGLAVGQAAPSLPFGGSDCLGVAIEIGPPTVLAKARLEGVPEHGLIGACAAVGGAEGGFAEVGAYAAVSAADGASVVVLEFGNLKRSPIFRALAVLDIEAERFGGRLGQTALLSHVPLDALLDILKARMGLTARSAQVLETHLVTNGPR